MIAEVAPDADSLVAVIVAVPAPTAVTVTVIPLEVLTELDELTVNTDGSLETQFTVRPLSGIPPAAIGVAVSNCVVPSTIGVVAADSATAATGSGGAPVTVMLVVPDFPSLVAVIVTGPPALTAVTSPLASTFATSVVPETHSIPRSVRALPLPSLSVAALLRATYDDACAERCHRHYCDRHWIDRDEKARSESACGCAIVAEPA